MLCLLLSCCLSLALFQRSVLVELQHVDVEDGEILGLQLAELGLEQRILSVHELNGVLEVLLKLLAQQLIALLSALCAHLGALELGLVVDRLQPVVLDG